MTISGEVYGLYCVCKDCSTYRSEEVRYVGVTVEGIEKRLRAHLNESRSTSKKAKDHWIRKHGEHNIRTRLLESVTTSIEDLRIAEIAWISSMGTFGNLNMTRGGDGIWGYRFSDEVRERFRERTAQQMAVKHPRARISEDDAKEIIRRAWNGESNPEISRDYPLSESSVGKIVSGVNWPHLERPDYPRPRRKKKRNLAIPLEVAQSIRDSATGEWGDLKRLASKFGVCETTVSLILNCRGRYKLLE